jgi:hypothetical protein
MRSFLRKVVSGLAFRESKLNEYGNFWITNGVLTSFTPADGCTDIEIPDNVTSIGEAAFKGCSSLTSVVIPDSVTSIGNGAFKVCSSLTWLLLVMVLRGLVMWHFGTAVA